MFYIVFTFSSSRTLDKHLIDYTLDEDFAWKTIRQVAEGLAYVHEKRIIHRDLNPKNILFDSLGDVKIGDFGLGQCSL